MKFKKSTRFLLSLCLMTLTFLCGGNKAWAAEQTYSYIQSGTTSPFKVSGQTGTATLSGVAWTVTSTATTLVTDANTVSKTNQFYFGNSKSKPGTLTLKTSGISGTIKSISIKAKVQKAESNATIAMSVNGSSYTSGDATSVKISGTSFNTYTFTGSSSGEIIITAGNFTAGYFGIASITIVYEEATSTTPTLKASSTTLSFPNTEANTSSTQTFTLSGKNLTGDATLSLSGTNAKLFNVTPTTVTQTDGAITNKTVTVTYTPTEAGTHTATLTISSDGANEQKITLNGTAYQIYNVNWKVNGADYTEGTPTTKVKSGSAVTTLPTAPSKIAGKTFVGWTDAEITTSSVSAPAILFTKAANAPTVTGNVTYYAVFASASETGETSEELTQTLEYDTWTYGGSTTDKNSYRLLHTNGYIESTEFDLSTLSKVIVYGGTFGGTTNNRLNIGNGTTTWKDVTVSGSSNTGVNTYTDGTPLSGKGTLKITSMSGSNSGTGSGIRVSKIEIYTLKSNITYSDYVTTVSDKLPAQLKFDQEIYNIEINGNVTVNATNASGTSIVYSVADETHCLIDAESGYFTADAIGTYIVTATCEATETYEGGIATCQVVVSSKQPTQSPTSFYKKITSVEELTENQSYLIVCETASAAFGEITNFSTGTNSNYKGKKEDVTIVNGQINLSKATGTPIKFVLETSGSNYKLKNPSTGLYLYTPSGTAIEETSDGSEMTISFDDDGTVRIVGISGRYIFYSTTYNYFGNFSSTNINTSGYAKAQLYKQVYAKVFSDTEDLTEYLPASDLADQTITLDRKVYEGWNTFCVPFALTQAQLEEAYGSGAVAKYLESVTTDGENATLHFTPEEEGGIEANKAYLLYLTADVMEAKTFSGVTLEPAGTCTTPVSDENGDVYTFQGILKPTTLETDDTQYFLNSLGTNFVLPSNSTSAMKATRAYITVPAASATAQGRHYSFDFNGTTTGIDNVNISGLEDGAWYTISGIRVNRPAAKGVYIHNGRKVIVK